MLYTSVTIANILADHKQDLFSNRSTSELHRIADYSTHMRTPEVSVVTGVRRCGKSTFLRQIGVAFSNQGNIHYINFEDQRLSRFHVDDFRIFFQEFLLKVDQQQPILIIYDEIQVVEEWERWVAELSSKKSYKVFISGSNAKLLSSELATLLTGRHRDIHLWPLSFAEIVQNNFRVGNVEEVTTDQSTSAIVEKRKLFESYLTYGGFPRAFLDQDCTILRQYFSDILLKDIIARKRIRHIDAVQEVGSLLCSTNSRIFSKRKTATQTLGINLLTVTKFCDYFVDSYLFSEIKLFSRSKRKQIAGRSKFYCVDPLVAKQTGFYYSNDSKYWILENHICNELLRRGMQVHYWHSRDGYEVDFIATSTNGRRIAIQSAVSLDNPEARSREIRALKHAMNELDINQLLIITENTAETIPLENTVISVIPFYDWALGFGRDHE